MCAQELNACDSTLKKAGTYIDYMQRENIILGTIVREYDKVIDTQSEVIESQKEKLNKNSYYLFGGIILGLITGAYVGASL